MRSSGLLSSSGRDGESNEDVEPLKDLSLLSKQMLPVEQKIRGRHQSATKLVSCRDMPKTRLHLLRWN